MNFAKAVNLAMRNGFANFRKVGCEFRNAKFRNGFDCETNEQCIGIANLKLALRNWHCEVRIANLALRNFRIAKLVCELTANFGIFAFALPNSLHLRNSHLQALSSSPINATDFQTW